MNVDQGKEDLLREIRDLARRLDRIDKALGLKDCAAEEKAKREFEERIDGLIRQAEELKKSVNCEEGCEVKQTPK